MKILVVDDNRDGCDLMVKCLKKRKHEAVAAYTGALAIQQTQDFQPEIILLDIGLPDIDGWEVAKEIRKSNKDIKIYALSGYSESSDIERSMEAGMNYHFVKPLDMCDLCRVVNMQGIDQGI